MLSWGCLLLLEVGETVTGISPVHLHRPFQELQLRKAWCMTRPLLLCHLSCTEGGWPGSTQRCLHLCFRPSENCTTLSQERAWRNCWRWDSTMWCVKNFADRVVLKACPRSTSWWASTTYNATYCLTDNALLCHQAAQIKLAPHSSFLGLVQHQQSARNWSIARNQLLSRLHLGSAEVWHYHFVLIARIVVQHIPHLLVLCSRHPCAWIVLLGRDFALLLTTGRTPQESHEILVLFLHITPQLYKSTSGVRDRSSTAISQMLKWGLDAWPSFPALYHH